MNYGINKRILYVGPLGGTCLSRMNGLKRLGAEVIPVDTDFHIFSKNRWVHRVHAHLLIGPGIHSLNKEIQQKAHEHHPDIIWIDKGNYVWPDTLKSIKRKTNAVLVHHNTDDIKNNKHKFKFYLQALDIYDAHFTSNLYNVKEMKSMTKSYIGYNELGYDDEVFRPLDMNEVDERFKSDIYFIGHWEPNTEMYIRALVEDGLPVVVRGEGWIKLFEKRRLKDYVRSGSIYNEDYVKALNGGKIGLGIYSKWNRNTTAARVFEIPACSTMLLTIRTGVLEELYEDGKEAAFFDHPAELVQKVRYYLNNDTEREAIALAGKNRCINNQCSWKDRVSEVLTDLKSVGILQ